MRLSEVADLFGRPTPSPEAVARRHGWRVEDINRQLEQGISVETEHTTDQRIAREIALDHLWERPDYYQRLRAVEK